LILSPPDQPYPEGSHQKLKACHFSPFTFTPFTRLWRSHHA